MVGETLPPNWRWSTLDDVKACGRAIVSGPFGSNIGSKFFVERGVPVIRGNNLSSDLTRFIDSGFVFVTEAKAKELANCEAVANDLVFTAAGSLGQVGIIPEKGHFSKYIISNKQMRARLDHTTMEPLFAFYWFSSPEMVRYVEQRNTGSSVPLINLSVLRGLPIPIPPLEEQRAILNILNTLDSKIELNRCINATLEQIAHAIFKAWFVDFHPCRAPIGKLGTEDLIAEQFSTGFENSPFGPVPKGWPVVELGEICKPALGGVWGEDTKFDDAQEAICLRGVDLEHLRQDGTADAPRRWISAGSIEKRAMATTDVLIAASGAGPCGRPLWFSPSLRQVFDRPVVYSNFCKRLTTATTDEAIYVDRVLHEMRQSGEIWEYVSGTSVPNLDLSGLLRGKLIVLPDRALLSRFAEIVKIIDERLYCPESRILAELRNGLLPKLLSGQIRIKQAEKMIEAQA